MTVAVAMNSTPEGREALVKGSAEAQLRGDALVVLSVLDTDEVTAADREAVDGRVREVLGDGQFTARVEPDGGDEAGAIVDLAAEVGATLVVIGSKRRSAVGKFLMGSTVQRVLLDCPVPVMVVKADH
ncbi:universal stress protein [Rhodococcoides corynebacterioides]|uniref:universal stress protein n=1 Tax=Rhodococcoides corynebacterioides TaxID=53972 RepID=UPI00082BE939|nr:universal stress protein [Rhodococcus corynebacterioides]MBY6351530.1 universal stress protein [Rhodococcus corynebacterioides]MBY6363936.1 universal stress protein [Rhodococcus corynebacterioides]